jgi:hypothetical protein
MVRAAILVSCLCLPCLAHAQIYVCKDAAGRTITSDRVIPECAARPMRELGNNGYTRREIPAPLTAEQKRQIELETERQRAEEIAATEARRRDQAILERFRSEAEIHAAHKRAVMDVQEKIRLETITLGVAEKQLRESTADAEKHRGKAGPPPALMRKVEEAQNAVNAENNLIQQRQAEQLKVGLWFDETLKRYRDLTGASAAR